MGKKNKKKPHPPLRVNRGVRKLAKDLIKACGDKSNDEVASLVEATLESYADYFSKKLFKKVSKAHEKRLGKVAKNAALALNMDFFGALEGGAPSQDEANKT